MKQAVCAASVRGQSGRQHQAEHAPPYLDEGGDTAPQQRCVLRHHKVLRGRGQGPGSGSLGGRSKMMTNARDTWMQ